VSATVGVLALQGGFAAHEQLVRSLGARALQVRTPEDLEELDALIIPGGESTVMTLGVERDGLAEPLRELVRRGTPVLGTCAGMIMLDRDHLGLAGLAGGPVHAIFIRAPWVRDCGEDVEVLATVDGHPVAVRQDKLVAVAFHPELAGERRLHELVLGLNGMR
jgi:5'-phosphate synthase pdxT subunit